MSEFRITIDVVRTISKNMLVSINKGVSQLQRYPLREEIMVLLAECLELTGSVALNDEETLVKINGTPILKATTLTIDDTSLTQALILAAMAEVAGADVSVELDHFITPKAVIAFYLMALFLAGADQSCKTAKQIPGFMPMLAKYVELLALPLNERNVLLNLWSTQMAKVKIPGCTILERGDTFFSPSRFYVKEGRVANVCGRLDPLSNNAVFSVYPNEQNPVKIPPGFYRPEGGDVVVCATPWYEEPEIWSLV